jgi:hypothetical protein
MSSAPNLAAGKAGAEECGVREKRERLSGFRPSLHERGEQPIEGVRPVELAGRLTVHLLSFPRVGLLERAALSGR